MNWATLYLARVVRHLVIQHGFTIHRWSTSSDGRSHYLRLRGHGCKCVVRVSDHRSIAFRPGTFAMSVLLHRPGSLLHAIARLRWLRQNGRLVPGVSGHGKQSRAVA